jgi:hypothetical protein
VAKDGLYGIHISASLEEIKRETVAKVVTAPPIQSGVLPSEDLDILVNLVRLNNHPIVLLRLIILLARKTETTEMPRELGSKLTLIEGLIQEGDTYARSRFNSLKSWYSI